MVVPPIITLGAGCFLAGTQITTRNGNKALDDIRAGDNVLSYNEGTGTLEYAQVIETIAHTAPRYLIINNDEL